MLPHVILRPIVYWNICLVVVKQTKASPNYVNLVASVIMLVWVYADTKMPLVSLFLLVVGSQIADGVNREHVKGMKRLLHGLDGVYATCNIALFAENLSFDDADVACRNFTIGRFYCIFLDNVHLRLLVIKSNFFTFLFSELQRIPLNFSMQTQRQWLTDCYLIPIPC